MHFPCEQVVTYLRIWESGYVPLSGSGQQKPRVRGHPSHPSGPRHEHVDLEGYHTHNMNLRDIPFQCYLYAK